MNSLRIILLCGTFSVIGYFVGNQTSESAPEVGEEQMEDAATKRTTLRQRIEQAEARSSRASSRDSRSISDFTSGGTTADLTREMIATWNDQEITLPDGHTTELLIFDLRKYSQLLSSLDRANEDEVAQIRGFLLPEDNDSFEADILKTIGTVLLASRDIQIHGSLALDDTIARARANPDNTDIEDIMPTMLYTLAEQDPAAAEKWLIENEANDELEDYLDFDSMKAAMEKSRAKR